MKTNGRHMKIVILKLYKESNEILRRKSGFVVMK